MRRIARTLKKEGVVISYGCVWKILRRYKKLKPRERKTVRRTGRRYYNPLDFDPFQFMQLDLKEIIDGSALPKDVYYQFLKLKETGVLMYRFTAIDVKTRIRFIAYAQEKSFANGWAFILLVIFWLRAFGISHRITIQTDWGEEFGGKSQRKIREMNNLLANLNAEITRIQKGKKEQNGYVERSHRIDDEELYIPYGKEIKDIASQFHIGYSWIRYYNTLRPHYGKELDGKTPLEYLKEIMPEIHPYIALFPPVFLDKIATASTWRGGKDMCKHYTISSY